MTGTYDLLLIRLILHGALLVGADRIKRSDSLLGVTDKQYVTTFDFENRPAIDFAQLLDLGQRESELL